MNDKDISAAIKLLWVIIGICFTVTCCNRLGTIAERLHDIDSSLIHISIELEH